MKLLEKLVRKPKASGERTPAREPGNDRRVAIKNRTAALLGRQLSFTVEENRLNMAVARHLGERTGAVGDA